MLFYVHINMYGTRRVTISIRSEDDASARGKLIISTAAVALAKADKTNERRGAC